MVFSRVRIIANPPVGTLPTITTYAANWVPNEGVSFYVSPAPTGAKSVKQTAPTEGDIVKTPPTNDVKSPDGSYSVLGPISSWAGKATEASFEIRFMPGDSNYAVTLPRGKSVPVPPDAKYSKIPFGVFQDTTRVWPVFLTSTTDTLWNIDPLNGTINGKPLFDKIVGIVDVKDGSNNVTSYYATLIKDAQGRNVPNNSNVVKGRLINGANWSLKDITFVNEKADGVPPANGTSIKVTMFKSIKPGDVRRFTVKAIELANQGAAKAEVAKVNVFPNPYYGVNTSELRRESRFVTINHLPKVATIRIFNLAGHLVNTIQKDGPSQFINWDLLNHKGLPVASGIYLLHIDMGDLGVKILKSAIIMEQQFLDNY
jgi:hypothetical protein